MRHGQLGLDCSQNKNTLATRHWKHKDIRRNQDNIIWIHTKSLRRELFAESKTIPTTTTTKHQQGTEPVGRQWPQASSTGHQPAATPISVLDGNTRRLSGKCSHATLTNTAREPRGTVSTSTEPPKCRQPYQRSSRLRYLWPYTVFQLGMHAGYFCVDIIHRTRTWTTGSSPCVLGLRIEDIEEG